MNNLIHNKQLKHAFTNYYAIFTGIASATSLINIIQQIINVGLSPLLAKYIAIYHYYFYPFVDVLFGIIHIRPPMWYNDMYIISFLFEAAKMRAIASFANNIKMEKSQECDQTKVQTTFYYKSCTAILARIGAEHAAIISDKVIKFTDKLENYSGYIGGFAYCAISTVFFAGIISMILITYKLLSKGAESMAESGRSLVYKEPIIIDSEQAMTFYKDWIISIFIMTAASVIFFVANAMSTSMIGVGKLTPVSVSWN